MKIQPKVPTGETAIAVCNLSIGDCFISGGFLMMVISLDDDPEVLDLTTGEKHEYGDEVFVIPVDCTVSWTKKLPKKKKK